MHARNRIRKNRHRGITISAGVRYILAGFLRYGEETDDDDPFSVYNCSPYGAGAADYQPTSGSDCAGAGADRSVPVLSMKAKLEISGECSRSLTSLFADRPGNQFSKCRSNIRGSHTHRSVGERYSSASIWDKLVVEEVGRQQSPCLYGRKVDGRPEVVKTAPPEGLRGLVVLSRVKFDHYAAMVRQ